MGSLYVSTLDFHSNNLTEIQLIINEYIKEYQTVDISFFDGDVVSHFPQIEEIVIGILHENYFRVELLRKGCSTCREDILTHSINNPNFRYSITTGGTGTGRRFISFYRGKDYTDDKFKSSFGGELITKIRLPQNVEEYNK